MEKEPETQAIPDPLADTLAGMPTHLPAEPPTTRPRLPETIGPYEVIKELGRGGMGMVLLGYDPRSKSRVALKLLLQHAVGAALSRFRREFRAIQKLSHPRVIRVFDGNFDGETPYFAMEFVEGLNLRQYAHVRWGGMGGAGLPQGLPKLLELTGQIVEALGYIHSHRLVHRDFKPDNVMIDASGAAKLMDFGLAKQMDPESIAQTAAGMILGTVAYMAPEQILGHADLDGRTDLYALGVTLYELTTGQLPYRGELTSVLHQHLRGQARPPAELAAWLPAELSELILELMSRNLEHRPSSAQEVLARLGAMLVRSGAIAAPAVEEVTELLVPAFVGHDNLPEWLEARLAEAEGGEPGARLALVPAAAGMGKSRFLDAVADWARQQLLPLARSACRPERRSPFSAVAPMLDAAQKQVGWLSEEDREQMRALVALVPELGELLGAGEGATAEGAPAAGVAFLEAALQYQPLIFVLDDLHWADELSLEFLGRLARHGLPLRLLIVAAYRPEAVDAGHPVARLLEGGEAGPLPCLRHELGPLPREAAARLVGSALGGGSEGLEPELLSAVLDGAAGSPLSILRELHELVLRRRVQRQATRYLLAGAGPRPAPALDQSTQLLTLDSGPVPEARAVEQSILEAVAVFGKGLPMDILAGLVEAEEPAVLDALNRLLQRRVLHGGSGAVEAFGIAQEAIREALYQDLAPERRRSLHGKIARILEARGASIDALAYHYRAAGEAETALRYLLQCVDRALKLCAYRDAIRLADEGLAVLKESNSEALNLFFETKLLNRQCQAWYFLAKLDTALSLAQRALEAAKRGTDLHSVLTAENSLGIISKELMQLENSKIHFENALTLSKRLGQKNIEAFILSNLTLLKLLDGKGREDLEKAVQIAHELQELPLKITALLGLTQLELGEGNFKKTKTYLSQAITLALECDMKAEITQCNAIEGTIFKIQGHWREAEQNWLKALESGRQAADVYWLQRTTLELAELEMHRGHLMKAEQWLSELMPSSGGEQLETLRLQEPTQELRRLRLELRKRMARCEWGLALQQLRALPTEGEKRAILGLNLFLEAQLLASIGRLRECLPLFEQAEKNCDALQFGALIWVVRFTKMLFQLETARAPQGLLEPLATLIQEAEQRDLQMWIHILRLRWLAAKADPDSAQWREAFEFFERQGADADLARGVLLQAETLLNRRREADAAKLLAEQDARLRTSELPWVQLVHASLLAAVDKTPTGAEAAAWAMELLRRQSESLDEKDRDPFLVQPSVQRIRARLGRRR